MAVRVSHEEMKDYVLVRFEGQESYDDAVGFWKWLLEEGEMRERNKLLVVGEPSKPLNNYQVSMLCAEIARMGHGKTIAYVDPHDETYDTNSRGEKFVTNRGGNARVFKRVEDAMAWLEGND